MMINVDQSFASLDVPLVDLSNPADAGPAIFRHRGEIFQAFEINRYIFSFLLCGLIANGISLIDVVNASDFKVVGALSREGKGQNGK